MEKKNIIIISLDEVRPDHISCYGYKKIKTPAIDKIAKNGIMFETCISASDFTPIAMGSVITGKYPNKHGYRDAYSFLSAENIAKILKNNGYKTAGFVGNDLISKDSGHADGFDYWSQASKETSWLNVGYKNTGSDQLFHVGNYWVDDFFKWLNENYKNKFFIWGHLLETHEGSEDSLIEKGLIKEGRLSDFSYYDAKIKMADEKLIGRLLDTLDELSLIDSTIIIVMSDHGTNLGEHPADPIPWRDGEKKYPQHFTMYDHDLKVVLIIGGGIDIKGKLVKGMVRTVDIVPTLLDLLGIQEDRFDFDGKSLVPVIKNGFSEGKEGYSEDLFEARGKGALQSIRSDGFKFIRNLTLGIEEYYDLEEDPQEQNNIITTIDKSRLINLRKKLNYFLIKTGFVLDKIMPEEKKEIINKRLRSLGYIE